MVVEVLEVEGKFSNKINETFAVEILLFIMSVKWTSLFSGISYLWLAMNVLCFLVPHWMHVILILLMIVVKFMLPKS